jgi:hypothetical protein
VLAIRREKRKLESEGWRIHETDWEIHRGHRIGEIITDVRVSADGRHVWTKLSGPLGWNP